MISSFTLTGQIIDSMVWKGVQYSLFQSDENKSSEGETVESSAVQSTTVEIDDDWRNGERDSYCLTLFPKFPEQSNSHKCQIIPSLSSIFLSGDFFPLLLLPKEIIIIIFHLLSTADRLRARLCKALYQAWLLWVVISDSYRPFRLPRHEKLCIYNDH